MSDQKRYGSYDKFSKFRAWQLLEGHTGDEDNRTECVSLSKTIRKQQSDSKSSARIPISFMNSFIREIYMAPFLLGRAPDLITA